MNKTVVNLKIFNSNIIKYDRAKSDQKLSQSICLYRYNRNFISVLGYNYISPQVRKNCDRAEFVCLSVLRCLWASSIGYCILAWAACFYITYTLIIIIRPGHWSVNKMAFQIKYFDILNILRDTFFGTDQCPGLNERYFLLDIKHIKKMNTCALHCRPLIQKALHRITCLIYYKIWMI